MKFVTSAQQAFISNMNVRSKPAAFSKMYVETLHIQRTIRST